MKNLFVVLAIVICTSVNSFSQKKGEINLGLGSSIINYSFLSTGVNGSLFNNISRSSGSSSSSSSFSFLLGFFPANNFRLDGGMGINMLDGSDAAIYFDIGGRYFYYTNKKISLNGGIYANFGLTTGTERYVQNTEDGFYTYENKKPINLGIIPIEFQYWPLEGGALTTNVNYTRAFLNGGSGTGENVFGVDIGLLIRLK